MSQQQRPEEHQAIFSPSPPRRSSLDAVEVTVTLLATDQPASMLGTVPSADHREELKRLSALLQGAIHFALEIVADGRKGRALFSEQPADFVNFVFIIDSRG